MKDSRSFWQKIPLAVKITGAVGGAGVFLWSLITLDHDRYRSRRLETDREDEITRAVDSLAADTMAEKGIPYHVIRPFLYDLNLTSVEADALFRATIAAHGLAPAEVTPGDLNTAIARLYGKPPLVVKRSKPAFDQKGNLAFVPDSLEGRSQMLPQNVENARAILGTFVSLGGKRMSRRNEEYYGYWPGARGLIFYQTLLKHPGGPALFYKLRWSGVRQFEEHYWNYRYDASNRSEYDKLQSALDSKGLIFWLRQAVSEEQNWPPALKEWKRRGFPPSPPTKVKPPRDLERKLRFHDVGFNRTPRRAVRRA